MSASVKLRLVVLSFCVVFLGVLTWINWSTFVKKVQAVQGQLQIAIGADQVTTINNRTVYNSDLLFGTGKSILNVAGNVGIGTITPSQALEVVSSGGLIRLNRVGGIYNEPNISFALDNQEVSQIRGLSGGGIRITNGDSSVDWARINATGNVGIGAAPSSNSEYKLEVGGIINARGLYVDGVPYVGGLPSQWTTVGNDIYYNIGNVGVGTASPAAKLDVGGTTSEIKNTSGNISIIPNSNLLVSQGNVGIGTATPAFKLDVNGIINATSLYIGGSPYVGSQWTTVGTSIYYNGGNVGIGTADPAEKLEVGGTSATISNTSGNMTLTPATNLVVSRGNVGIGSANPTARLEVGGSSSIIANLSGNLTLTPAGNLVVSQGNVGIGTAAPASKLDVFGTLSVGNVASAGTVGKVQITSGGASPINNRLTFGTDGSGWGLAIGKNQGGTVSDIMTIKDNGYVGIGTTAPSTALQVNGTIKATKLDSAGGEYIGIYLSQCAGGPCGSNHALNTWTDAGGSGYSWTVHMNTAPDNFTHNGQGKITIAKAGLYQIQMQAMFIPTSATAFGEIICPYINGAPNCPLNYGYQHRYVTAGWWNQPFFISTFQLGAGATVSWGYHPIVTMSYWAHDGYTNISVTRIQ